MATSSLIRAALSSAAIVGGAALGVTIIPSSVDAKNFNKQQCRIDDPSVKALAVDEGGSAECVCPSGSSGRRVNDDQRPAGAASTADCYIQTPNQITISP